MRILVLYFYISFYVSISISNEIFFKKCSFICVSLDYSISTGQNIQLEIYKLWYTYIQMVTLQHIDRIYLVAVYLKHWYTWETKLYKYNYNKVLKYKDFD